MNKPLLTEDVCIEAVAYELPPHRISSVKIEEEIAETMARLGLERGQLERLTGIRERRFWDPETQPSEVATRAAERVIERAGISADRIGCLINTSVCRDYIEPSTACLVHGNLGLGPECINYDVGNACLGFVNAMSTITLMIEKGLMDYGLIVDGEGSRQVIEATLKRLRRPETTEKDFRENFATLTLGSGAVAMILAHRKVSRSGHRINGAVTRADTRYSRLCLGQPDRMVADPHRVLVHGVELALETWKDAQGSLPDWDDETIDLYVPHQVSQRNMEVLNRTLGLTPEKHHLNFSTLGNVGPAALPITLAQAEESGRLHAGSHIALMGIGSGLNCSMMSVSW
ncbi:MAG: 3-oxoacyl-ACP synthase III [Desulfobacteraceae bacterium]|nr:3-oxoacyl-ACP synthase III [Desulfobacteraceae bacterium]